MANLRRPFSFTKEKDNNIVGRVKPNGRCKKHPKHQQSPGVCSLCLREKLIKLSSSISRKTTTTTSLGSARSSSSVSSLSSYDSSSSASSCASPMHCFAPSGSNLVSIFLLMSGKHGSMRSKSMAVVSSRRDCEGGVHDHDHGHHRKSASKSGFWSKLLHPKRKITKDERDTKSLRSMSIREKVTITS